MWLSQLAAGGHQQVGLFGSFLPAVSTVSRQLWECTGPRGMTRGSRRGAHAWLLRRGQRGMCPFWARGERGADPWGQGSCRRWPTSGRGRGYGTVVRAKGRVADGCQFDTCLLTGEAGQHLSYSVAGELLCCAVLGRGRDGGGGWEIPRGKRPAVLLQLLQLGLALELVSGCLEALIDSSLIGGLMEAWAAQALGEDRGGNGRRREGRGGGAGGRLRMRMRRWLQRCSSSIFQQHSIFCYSVLLCHICLSVSLTPIDLWHWGGVWGESLPIEISLYRGGHHFQL